MEETMDPTDSKTDLNNTYTLYCLSICIDQFYTWIQ